jgi:hypothetical protein
MRIRFATVNNIPVADVSKNGVMMITTQENYQDSDGFDYDGYGRDGFNRAGYNRAGKDRKGYKASYKIGEDGPGGGVVFYASKKSGTGGVQSYLERIYINGDFTWDEAVAKCKALTTGGYSNWRLPSDAELEQMFKTLGSYDNHAYWSSSGRALGFNNGWVLHPNIFKNTKLYVCAVRVFSIKYAD